MADGASSDALDGGGVGGGGFGEVNGGVGANCFATIPAMPGKELRSVGLGGDAGAGMPIPAGAGADGSMTVH